MKLISGTFRHIVRLMWFSSLLISLSAAHADSESGSIVRVLTSSTQFLGCMVKLDTTVVGSNCSGEWVSLDCDGAIVSAESGKRAYASAMLAYTLNKQVTVHYNGTDRTPTGGYCVANRFVFY